MGDPRIKKVFGDHRLELLFGDITRQTTEAIVNAANSSLLGGGGVDGAIHRAGGPAILNQCRAMVVKIGRLPPGQAVITTGGKLAAKHVIHTVGPIWRGGTQGESAVLASAYRESLNIAHLHGIKSVSFPSISTGAYRFPLDSAAHIALSTVLAIFDEGISVREVAFVLFDRTSFETYGRVLESLASDYATNCSTRS
jgi:O-acetyl-ADP-ribose deacetylase